MIRRALFPLLALAVACSSDAMSPDSRLELGSEDLIGSADVSNPAHGGWDFVAVATFLGPVDPGVTKITPGNVLHTRGLVNEFALSGDLSGLVYFEGDFHNRLATGNGPIIGRAFFDLTAPQVGTLTCSGSALQLKAFGTPNVSAVGKITHCVGTGDYADSGMKGTWSLRSDGSTWDAVGTIY